MVRKVSSGYATRPAGYLEFEFDLPGALLQRLVEQFDRMDSVRLESAEVFSVPEEQGIYQLYLDDRLVYVGKTDADAGLRRRLSRHSRKILHRQNLDPSRVTFKAIRVFVFTAIDLESDLIRYYGGVAQIDWNGSGFGSNDPGRERDTTKVDPANFDARYPIDIDREIAFAIEEGDSAAVALARLKDALPYTFRFQSAGSRSRRPHPELELVSLGIMSGPISTRSAITHIVSALPAEWQATALLGYIILYREAPKTYPQSEVIAVGSV